MCPCVMRMDKIHASRMPPYLFDLSRMNVKALGSGRRCEGRTLTREQNGLMPRVPQRVQQQQYLMLAATHFGAGVDLQNTQIKFFALDS